MQDVAQILNNGTNIGILYEIKYNIPEEVKEALLKRVALVKNGIEAISKRFDLEKEHREATNKIFGKLPYCLEIIEDIKAKRLKRYGEVLDPQLNIIIALLSKMGRLLLGTPK
ncbi:MAG: hypothetical protein KGQ83_02265 [Planctomycetes bacterium]|nr:hypothetical protein [Planctomycetota bacterium]